MVDQVQVIDIVNPVAEIFLGHNLVAKRALLEYAWDKDYVMTGRLIPLGIHEGPLLLVRLTNVAHSVGELPDRLLFSCYQIIAKKWKESKGAALQMEIAAASNVTFDEISRSLVYIDQEQLKVIPQMAIDEVLRSNLLSSICPANMVTLNQLRKQKEAYLADAARIAKALDDKWFKPQGVGELGKMVQHVASSVQEDIAESKVKMITKLSLITRQFNSLESKVATKHQLNEISKKFNSLESKLDEMCCNVKKSVERLAVEAVKKLPEFTNSEFKIGQTITWGKKASKISIEIDGLCDDPPAIVEATWRTKNAEKLKKFIEKKRLMEEKYFECPCRAFYFSIQVDMKDDESDALRDELKAMAAEYGVELMLDEMQPSEIERRKEEDD